MWKMRASTKVVTLLDWERCEPSRDRPYTPPGKRVFNGFRRPVRGIRL